MNSEFERHTLSKLVHLDQKSLGKKTPEDFTFSYISLSDVSSGNISKTLEKHSFKSAPSRARRVLQNGDIILATVRPNLQGFAKITEEFSHCVASTGFAVLSPKDNVSGEFIYQCLYSYQITKQIESLVVGSNYPAINSSDVAGLHIYAPPYPEQRKIAKILSTWDKAISTTERLIDNSKQQKKALMQQLLTGAHTQRKRLLDDSGKPFEDEWEEFQLGELFKERVETGFNDLPLISITSTGGVISRDDVGRKDTSNKDKSKYRRICPNDIGYNTMRMWQGVSGLSDLEGIVSPAYTILIPQNGVSPKFASYLFKLPKLIHIFERNSQGLVSDTWNLKYPHFAKIKWHFPDYQEQEKIVSVLSNADKEIELLEQQLADLKQEKKALMQQLLTGKRRVTVS